MLHTSKKLSLSIADSGSTLRDTAFDPQEEPPMAMPLNQSELQFAGVLLRSAENAAGTPIVLFTALAEISKPLNSIRRVARAIHEIGSARVALVRLDPDERETQIHKRLDVAELNELRNWIAEGTASYAEIRWSGVDADAPGIVPTPEVADLFQRLKSSYDVICVDAGSIFSSSNALTTSPRCSGAVLMVERDVTAVRDVERAQRMLLQAGARVLGFAFIEQD